MGLSGCTASVEVADWGVEVRRLGAPLAEHPVTINGASYVTNDAGALRVLGTEAAYRVQVVDGNEAAVAFTCGEDVAMDLPAPRAVGQALAEVRLENVAPDVDVEVLWWSAGPDAPTEDRGSLADVPWTVVSRGPSALQLVGPVPSASRWVLVALAREEGEVTSLVAVQGDDLREDEELPIWVVMSDELLIGWPWDGALPEGASTVRVEQQLMLNGLDAVLTLADVSVDTARDVPVVDLGNQEVSLKLSAGWNPSRTCQVRDTGREFQGLFPREERVIGGLDAPKSLTPLSASVDPMGRVSWEQVPGDAAWLDVHIDDGRRRLHATGPLACVAEDWLDWPAEWAPVERAGLRIDVVVGQEETFSRCRVAPIPVEP